MGQQETVSMNEVRPSEGALRDAQKTQQEYEELKSSIKEKGLLQPITVRKKTDPETENEYYELIDGLQRFSILQELGAEEIPVHIMNFNDEEVLEAQIVANAQRVNTRKADYAKQLRRLMNYNPMLTSAEVGKKVGKSTAWVDSILGLNNLANEDIKEFVNEGKIKLANAFALSKLPPEEQPDWLERAMTDPVETFVASATERAKEIREQARKGKDAAPATFTPVAHLKKLKDLKDELDNKKASKVLASQNPDLSTEDAISLGIAYAVNLDPISVEEAKARWEEKQQEAEKKKAAKAAEKAAKDAESKAAALEEAKQHAANQEAIAKGETPPHPELIAKQEQAAAEKAAAKADAESSDDADGSDSE